MKLSAAFVAKFRQVYGALVAHLQQKGWLQHVRAIFLDEPVRTLCPSISSYLMLWYMQHHTHTHTHTHTHRRASCLCCHGLSTASLCSALLMRLHAQSSGSTAEVNAVNGVRPTSTFSLATHFLIQI